MIDAGIDQGQMMRKRHYLLKQYRAAIETTYVEVLSL
jgi:hypothetical protein